MMLPRTFGRILNYKFTTTNNNKKSQKINIKKKYEINKVRVPYAHPFNFRTRTYYS